MLAELVGRAGAGGAAAWAAAVVVGVVVIVVWIVRYRRRERRRWWRDYLHRGGLTRALFSRWRATPRLTDERDRDD